MKNTESNEKAAIKVTQSVVDPIPVEVLATSIKQIADGMAQITSTRLTRKALVALIHDNSKIARRDIEIVLNNLVELERTWLKPAPIPRKP